LLTPTEARLHVRATWSDPEPDPPSLQLNGRVTGPFCEYAKTLTDRVPLTPHSAAPPLQASARVLEPCFWEPQHPFYYEVHVELQHASRVVDTRRVLAGVRHLELNGGGLLLNGQPIAVEGVREFGASSITELQAWHEVGCNAFLGDASTSLCDRTDRWGPMVFHVVGRDEQSSGFAQIRQLRNHPSLLMWVLPPGSSSGDAMQHLVTGIRAADPSRRIGRLVGMKESTTSLAAAEILFLPIGHPEILAPSLERPFIVVGSAPPAHHAARDGNDEPDEERGCQPDAFHSTITALRDSIGSRAGLIGVIA
jgi:hypothetical protein